MEGDRTFGQWVKNQRKALGLTQANLAQRVACSKSMINKIESDLRSPAKSLIELLAQNLKISSADYAEFVHAAQPHLLIDRTDFGKKDGVNIPGIIPSLIKNPPAPLTPLIGREKDIAVICAYLQQPTVRLLTLTGPGGIGKTRMALQIANEMKDKYADGVFFISLAPIRDQALILSTIVQALGLKSESNQRDDELLVTYLNEKSVLLILDNFEQALPAAKSITELLMFTSYVKVLVTSRAVLRLSGEHEFVVPPLDLPPSDLSEGPNEIADYPAVDLFVRRAQAVRSDFSLNMDNYKSIVDICIRLEGAPLAIELAAARCKALSPQAILARLTSTTGGVLNLLTGGVQDMPARQQTIRQTIEWSYNLLSENSQILFRRLGIFIGGCTLDAVENIYSHLKAESKPSLRLTHHISALDLAMDLIDKSLIRRIEGKDGEPRFFMSETLREYALESLTVANELEMMKIQQAAYSANLIDKLSSKLRGVELESSMKLLDEDYGNIRTSLEWSASANLDLGLRMVSKLWEYWLTRGYLSEGRTWLTSFLKKTEGKYTQSNQARAQALNGLGLITSVQGNQELASIYLHESLLLFRDLKDQLGEAWVLNHLGQTLNLSGHSDDAILTFNQSLKLFQEIDEQWHCAWVLLNLGEVSFNKEDFDQSMKYLLEARELFYESQDKRGTAAAIDRLARLNMLLGNNNLAKSLLMESLRLFGETEDREGCGWTLHHLGRLAYEEGFNIQAVNYFIESLKLFEKLNDRWGFAWSLFRLAKIVGVMELTKKSAILFGAAESMMYEFNNRLLAADLALIYDTFVAEKNKSDMEIWSKGQLFSVEKALSWILEQTFFETPDSPVI